MKLRFNPFLCVTAVIGAACTVSVNAEILTFDGNQATDVTTHTINATDWADYVGGSGTFNSANDWGRLYWRGSAGDGQYIHFDLSTLSGLTLVAPATVTLQNGNATWGGGVNGSFVATADGSWTAGGGQPIPGATPITNAVNATGSYGNGASVSWGIGASTFQDIVTNQSSFNGFAVIGGSGSQLHFTGPTNPYLTVQTGAISAASGIITADTGSSVWNGSSYNFVGSNSYSPTINTLSINGELAAGNSGAGTIAINNGGTVAVNQAGSVNYYQAIDGTTINTGGKLTINAHSNISNLTLAGGELASTGSDATWGSWGINGTTTATGGVTSTISANQVTLSSGVFEVGSGSTLNFTGWASGGSLTKTGAGTMQFRGWQSYTGGTTINNGTLELVGQNSGYGWLRGAVTVNSGGTLKFIGGDGSGFGWNGPATSLTVDGGTFDAASGTHLGFGSAMTVVLKNGATMMGAGQWNGGTGTPFSASGDSTNTISGSWNLRGDGGGNHSIDVADGAAATDLLVNANLSDQWPEVGWVPRGNLIKTGAGQMLVSGSNSFDGQTNIQAGTLVAASSNALGAGGWDGNTMSFIQNDATLALQGGISLNEHFHIWGSGVGGLGALRSISGDNALTMTYGNSGNGPGFALRSNTTVGVDADTLAVTGFYEDGGSWGLTKIGNGTLRFTNFSYYTGGTTVDAGTLILDGNNGGNCRVRGALTVNNGTTVSLVNDDGTGLGYNPGAKVTVLNINGGTVSSAGTMHVWNFSGGVNMTGGTLQSNSGTSDASGPQLEWANTPVTTNASAGTATIGGRIRMRADGGSTGIVFNVADGDASADLLVSAAITQANAGMGITKNGAGTMVLGGANSYTGSTVVNEGTVSLTNPVLDDAAPVVIGTNAKMDLNFVGADIVGSIDIDGSGSLPAGTYDSTHPTYGEFFTGGGSLVVTQASGTWTSLTDGNWSDAANWLSDVVAVGTDATATFGAATGAIVNLDSNRSIGNLVFDVSDYTLAGSNTLLLESSGIPFVSVANGINATISANLAGNAGLEKTGSGSLILSGVKSYTGGTTVTAGTLELASSSYDISAVSGSLTVASGATLKLAGLDFTGLGRVGSRVSYLEVNDGTVENTVQSWVSGATVNLTGSSMSGGTYHVISSAFNSSESASTSTISSNLLIRKDYGSTDLGVSVADGTAATDLLISGNISNVFAAGLIKSGSGKLVLSGNNTYTGNTVVGEGALEVTSGLLFRPTTNGATNSVSGSEGSSLSFLGAVNLDLSAADTTDGNVWNLFQLSTLTGTAPVLAPTAITSGPDSFTEVTPGSWELSVTNAKWVFTEADGNLTYTVTATDFDNWKTANGVIGGENDDDDNDGLTNQEEYAFGLNPTGGASVNAISVALDATTGTFSYTRRQQSLTGLSYSVWYSTDLGTWAEDGNAVQGNPSLNGEVETVPVTLSPALLSNTKLFIQVRAQ